MIETSGISYTYDDKHHFEFPDISCEGAETCLILGKSGVGKTTLLHLLAGLMPLQKGDVKIDGRELNTIKNHSLDEFRGKNIGIIFQKPHFISSISILSNLLLTQTLAGRKKDKDEIMQILEKLEVKHRAHAKPNELSQGELQRASVARAILNKPKVILADEPTSALDDVSCDQVLNLLQNASKELNAALLIVTHDGRLKSIIDNKILLS